MRWVGQFGTGEILEPVRRFPLPALFAVLATLLNWNAPNLRMEYGSAHVLLTLYCMAAFLWTWAAALWAQTTQSGRVNGLLVGAGGAVLLALILRVDLALPLWLVPEPGVDVSLTVSHALLLGALVLAPSLAPFLFPAISQSAFWQYNHKWLVGLLAAWIGSLLAFAGVAAILATAALVFEVRVPNWIYGHVWIVASTLVMPWIWLSLSPQEFREEAKTGAAQEFTSRAIGLLVIYILVPVMLALSALLMAYVVKVFADGSYLTARLGLTGILYGVSVILVGLLAYPQRADYPLVRLFWWIRPFLLIAPVVLLFPALWVRVAEYGWTPSRYVALIAGLWVAGVLAIGIVARRDREEDMRAIPGLLALLLALTAFGPWSVANVPAASQYGRLEALLSAKGLLANGRWRGTDRPIPWDRAAGPAHHSEPGAVIVIGDNDRIVARSALDTLWTSGQLDRLRPWFEGQPDSPFENTARGRGIDLVQQKMGLLFALPVNAPGTRIFFSAANPIAISLPGGAGTLVGPLGVTNLATRQTFDTAGGKASLVMDGRQLHLDVGAMRIASFDLAPTLDRLKAQAAASMGTTPSHGPAIMLEGNSPERARLALTFVSGTIGEAQANVQVTAYVLLFAPQ